YARSRKAPALQRLAGGLACNGKTETGLPHLAFGLWGALSFLLRFLCGASLFMSAGMAISFAASALAAASGESIRIYPSMPKCI
ncbi:MAG: hypothetical protein LBJ10_00645, partial [Clostridiales bacterium]|nr:hypothetical protein [Clostridiales bacterium]